MGSQDPEAYCHAGESAVLREDRKAFAAGKEPWRMVRLLKVRVTGRGREGWGTMHKHSARKRSLLRRAQKRHLSLASPSHRNASQQHSHHHPPSSQDAQVCYESTNKSALHTERLPAFMTAGYEPWLVKASNTSRFSFNNMENRLTFCKVDGEAQV